MPTQCVQSVVDAVCALWGQAVLRRPGGSDVTWEIRGPGSPDLEVVDTLARCQLLASRLGWSLAVRDPCPQLADLLELAGLLLLIEP